jgi:hypothetical protein
MILTNSHIAKVFYGYLNLSNRLMWTLSKQVSKYLVTIYYISVSNFTGGNYINLRVVLRQRCNSFLNGHEVLQLYVCFPAEAEQPICQLRGFERVFLTTTLDIAIRATPIAMHMTATLRRV